jgi:hypothetical protein
MSPEAKRWLWWRLMAVIETYAILPDWVAVPDLPPPEIARKLLGEWWERHGRTIAIHLWLVDRWDDQFEDDP